MLTFAFFNKKLHHVHLDQEVPVKIVTIAYVGRMGLVRIAYMAALLNITMKDVSRRNTTTMVATMSTVTVCVRFYVEIL